MTTVYNLSKISECNIMEMCKELSSNNEHAKKNFKNANIKLIQYNNDNGCYHILKYDKSALTKDNIQMLGLFRSVILKNGNIVGYSPPKSVSIEDFFEKNKDPHSRALNCYAEEFIEGTMINVFFDHSIDDWEICTKSNVGAKCVFFREGEIAHDKTFRYMFLEAVGKINLEFDDLPKEYSYSFILQHPKNRIVTPFSEQMIYLVGCYKINNEDFTVSEVSRDNQLNIVKDTDIRIPTRFSFDNYEELYEKWAGANVDYKTMGVIVKNGITGERSKIRNPSYELVRRLRGNQPKLQYQYLVLRKEGEVSKYLEYFEEAKSTFVMFRDQVHMFTKHLHNNYIMCYIKKTMPLIEYPTQYRTHMFNLHKMYLDYLRDRGEKISKQRVIEYVNNLHPAKLMFSINFPMRQRQVDTIVNYVED